jgi:hypothetical protein
MTDNQSNIAGTYKGTGPIIECILDEGAPTITNVSHMETGQTLRTLVFASPLEEGQVVALANGSENTYVATEGAVLVERAQNAESLVIGQIITTPKLKRFPATSADADSLAKRLAGKYFRTALVEIHIPGRLVAAQIMQNGTNALVPGVMTTLNFNITKAYASGNDGYFFDSGSANGVGGIPLHYVAAGTDGDLSTALVLLTGLLYAVTGA